jgi:hypothetical protein
MELGLRSSVVECTVFYTDMWAQGSSGPHTSTAEDPDP